MFRSILRGYGVGLGVDCLPHYWNNPYCNPMYGQQMFGSQMIGYPMHGYQTHGCQGMQPGVAYPVQDTTTQRPFRGGRG